MMNAKQEEHLNHINTELGKVLVSIDMTESFLKGIVKEFRQRDKQIFNDYLAHTTQMRKRLESLYSDEDMAIKMGEFSDYIINIINTASSGHKETKDYVFSFLVTYENAKEETFISITKKEYESITNMDDKVTEMKNHIIESSNRNIINIEFINMLEPNKV